MINIDDLFNLDRSDSVKIKEQADKYNTDDIAALVNFLSDKDDKLRYPSLLLLLSRSSVDNSIYKYLDVFLDKLKDENSYQRSIGMQLIAANAKWDKGDFDKIFDSYATVLEDEKPINVRQCIQSLAYIIPYKNQLCERIADKLISIDINNIKETMRKLILTDILNAFVLLKKYFWNDKMEKYVISALTGEILDKKTKKQFENLL